MRKILSLITLLAFALPVYAAEMGDDGLHKETWMRDTFKDLQEDLAEANAEGKRLMIIVEQRGCIYCRKMHEEVFPVEEIANYIKDNYFVLQMNMFGDVEVTDFDGEVLPVKDMVKKWGVLFTPTIMFFPTEVGDDKTAQSAAVAVMPGAFGKHTTLDMLTWVVENGYDSEESFQKYHARKLAERGN